MSESTDSNALADGNVSLSESTDSNALAAGDIPLPSSAGAGSNGSTTVTTLLPGHGVGIANQTISDTTGPSTPPVSQACDANTLAYYQAYYAQCGYPGYPATGTNIMVPTGTNVIVPTVPSGAVTSYPIPVTNSNSASSGYDFRTQVPVAVPPLQTSSIPPLASNLVPQVPILAPHLQPVPITIPGTCTSIPAVPGPSFTPGIQTPVISGIQTPAIPGIQTPAIPGVPTSVISGVPVTAPVYPVVPIPPIRDAVPDGSFDTKDGLQEEEDPTVDKNYGKAGGGANDPLPIHGNQKTMNLNPLLLTNIQQSTYFKVTLYKLKTINELIDEIWYNVKHMEPWERGSRKVGGQTGMCGSVRGVGSGGIVSTPFCILYKLFTLKPSRKQVNYLIKSKDSPYIRAIGLLFIRYTQSPDSLWSWYKKYLSDEEEYQAAASGTVTMTIGEMCRNLLTKLEWFSTLFPRIPVPIQKEIQSRLADYDRGGYDHGGGYDGGGYDGGGYDHGDYYREDDEYTNEHGDQYEDNEKKVDKEEVNYDEEEDDDDDDGDLDAYDLFKEDEPKEEGEVKDDKRSKDEEKDRKKSHKRSHRSRSGSRSRDRHEKYRNNGHRQRRDRSRSSDRRSDGHRRRSRSRDRERKHHHHSSSHHSSSYHSSHHHRNRDHHHRK